MAHRKPPPGTYRIRDHKGTYRTIEIENLMGAARQAALGCLAKGPTIRSPRDTQDYLQTAIGHLPTRSLLCSVARQSASGYPIR